MHTRLYHWRSFLPLPPACLQIIYRYHLAISQGGTMALGPACLKHAASCWTREAIAGWHIHGKHCQSRGFEDTCMQPESPPTGLCLSPSTSLNGMILQLCQASFTHGQAGVSRQAHSSCYPSSISCLHASQCTMIKESTVMPSCICPGVCKQARSP